ncbi:PREDICTED: uncharacterized protein LOC108611257 [Drosophila arizonae]|uniref:Uncharacterized protein LOC108611257 n=1 Tax=Drosophila arizonae TaxID=7263 RepID=A0ABM1NWE0_DROAR|nr:PREDICTED: uncharacterized protein LOC108611257 [Drosophila arizonae]
MKLLKKCCFCVDLRCGSFIIYVFEFMLSFYAICLGQWSSGNKFLIVSRLGGMIYLIGNVFLLMGIIYKSPNFLLVYLISSGIHLGTSLIYFIILAATCNFCVYLVSFILLTMGMYDLLLGCGLFISRQMQMGTFNKL